MQNRHDNDVRSKLESMDAVPAAFKFNAVGTWQKMEQQLQPVSRKKRGFVWMYWAAACLLFVVGIVIFGSTGKKLDNNLPEMSIQKETTKPKNVVPVATISSKEEARITDNTLKGISSSTSKGLVPKPTIITIKKEKPFTEDTTKHEQVSIVQEPVNHLPITTNNATEPPVKTVTAVVKKAKLKVIHINELDAPPPPIIAKLDKKKQQQDDATDSEPAKPFWQKKPKPVNAPSSNTDNR